MIYIFETFACLAEALVAAWFISKTNKAKLINPKSLLFFIVYFLFNITLSFFGIYSEFVMFLDFILLLGSSLILGSYRRASSYISPLYLFFTSLSVEMFVIVFMLILHSDNGDLIKTFFTVGQHGVLRIKYLIFTKCVIFIFLLLYFLFSAIFTKIKEKRDRRLLEKQMLVYEQKRYSDIEKNLEQIKKIRHDIKNKLFVVKLKLDKTDYIGASQQLNAIIDEVSSVGYALKTKNALLDYFVNTKLGNLSTASVVVTGDISILDDIKEIDLAVMLGNVLDNAAEAVKNIENPKIELSFYQKNNYKNIICKNSITASVLDLNPSLKTTKDNKFNHGYGIKSVKETVNKLNGEILFSEKENMFTVHILIPTKE